MFFSMPIKWYHFHVDPIWPDGTYKKKMLNGEKSSTIKHISVHKITT